MVREISAARLEEWITEEGPGPLIIDVRTEPEYELGHVPGSTNVPMARLTEEIDIVESADRVVLICEVGELSAQAGSLIKAYEGVDESVTVANLTSGYRGWMEYSSSPDTTGEPSHP